MGIKCRIKRGSDGQVESYTTESGNRSKLFDSLSNIVGKEKALDLVALANTEEVKTKKTLQDNKKNKRNDNSLAKQAKELSTFLGSSADRAGSFKFQLGSTSIFYKGVGNKRISLELVETPAADRGKGSAKAAMESFLSKVGSQGFTVDLIVSPRDKSTKESKLKSFYEKVGFIANSTGFEMTRRPISSDKNLKDVTEISSVKVEPIEEEVTVEEIMEYAVATNENLTEKEVADLQNTSYSLGVNSYSEMIDKLKKGLSRNGILIFTEKTLKETGMFNTYEVNSILNSPELQESIKRVYQGLLKEENKVFEPANPAYIIKTSSINSLGKQEIMNPFHVEQEVATIVAGKEVDLVLDTIPYDSIKNLYLNNKDFKEELNKVANNTRNLPVRKIVGDSIEEKTENSNRESFEKTIDFDMGYQVEPIINKLSMVSEEVWNNSEDSVYTLLKEFNRKAALVGVDFMNLEDRLLTDTQEDIVGLLEAFSDLLVKPTENNMDYFFDVYSEFFQVSEEPLVKTVTTDKTDGIFLETDISEVSLFNEFGLVKQGENIYTEVEPIADIEEAYSILLQNKDMLPEYVKTIEDLKEYVSSVIEGYNLDSFEVNISELENMILHKIYFKAPITVAEKREVSAEVKYSNFKGDYNYLKAQFVSDFYKQYLKEKKAASIEFKDFYSNFRFDEKGITLINTDPITLAKMEPHTSQTLKNYNLISKNLNMPLKATEVLVDKNDMQFNREYAISNPSSVEKVKGDYSILSPETIAVKGEVKNFLKTPSGLFEYQYQIGDVALYNKLPEGNEYYNSYGQHESKPTSSVDARDYGNLESIPSNFVEAKKYYTKEELEQINENSFSC